MLAVHLELAFVPTVAARERGISVLTPVEYTILAGYCCLTWNQIIVVVIVPGAGAC
jgi:hypothetical protein